MQTSLEVFPKGSANNMPAICWDNGLKPIKWQAI